MNIVIGGGLSGLSAAWLLKKRGASVLLFEKEQALGGTARTMQHDGFRFDLGGHRFYTKDAEVLSLVESLLGDEIVQVHRKSSIFMAGRFVDYPLTFMSAFKGLGWWKVARVGGSYVAASVEAGLRTATPQTFEEWCVGRFGRALYQIYFKPYTEKIWGIPCETISADFATQRIRGLSMRAAIRNMFLKGANGPTTLVSAFLYPRTGFGRIAERLAHGLGPADVRTGAERVTEVVVRGQGRVVTRECAQLITSMPVSELALKLQPSAPAAVLDAARRLRYRDMVIVFIALDREHVTDDHWIYFSEERFSFGRLHEPKNWSPAMAPPGKTGLVLEFFCSEGDSTWRSEAETLVARAGRELDEIGLIRRDEIIGHRLVRLRRAYPLYQVGYLEHLRTVRDFLARFANLHCVGRNGLFRYTSGDYYIAMGLRAAENALGASHDLWQIATTPQYAES